MPVQNRRETSRENLTHFFTREGGDGFLHRRTRHFLRQRHPKRQGRETKQD
jgi:hypothetical protein